MANQHSEKLRGIRRVNDQLWADFKASAEADGSDRSAVLRQFMEWHTGRPDAELPQRPTPPVTTPR